MSLHTVVEGMSSIYWEEDKVGNGQFQEVPILHKSSFKEVSPSIEKPKFVGRSFASWYIIEFVSEGRVLPSMVLIGFIAYFAMATMFYNDFY